MRQRWRWRTKWQSSWRTARRGSSSWRWCTGGSSTGEASWEKILHRTTHRITMCTRVIDIGFVVLHPSINTHNTTTQLSHVHNSKTIGNHCSKVINRFFVGCASVSQVPLIPAVPGSAVILDQGHKGHDLLSNRQRVCSGVSYVQRASHDAET